MEDSYAIIMHLLHETDAFGQSKSTASSNNSGRRRANSQIRYTEFARLGPQLEAANDPKVTRFRQLQ
jgi:hypothetical protein